MLGSTMGGDASPVRLPAFKDERVLAAAKAGTGTTRHFPAIEWTIMNRMGSEPDIPTWAEIANNVIPVRLDELLAASSTTRSSNGGDSKETDQLAAPFRGHAAGDDAPDLPRRACPSSVDDDGRLN